MTKTEARRTMQRDGNDPRIDRAISWVLGVISTGALSWSIHSFGSLEKGISGLSLEVTRLTTQMQVNSQYLQEQKVALDRLEDRLRQVEKQR